MKFKGLILILFYLSERLQKEEKRLISLIREPKEFPSLNEAIKLSNIKKNGFTYYSDFMNLLKKQDISTKKLEKIKTDYDFYYNQFLKNISKLKVIGFKDISLTRRELTASSDLNSQINIHLTRKNKQLYIIIYQKNTYSRTKQSREFKKFSINLRNNINKVLESDINL